MGLKADRRIKERKVVEAIEVTELTSLKNYTLLAQTAHIIDASSKGFLLEIDRRDLIPDELKEHLTLDSLINEPVVMFLPQMNLDLDGTIQRARHAGKGVFHIAVDFSDGVPEYWRECLIDLLPAPGEID
ncbi:MAG: hypothetical protein KDD22_00425 [Bdellovibrionales bacterium]|nr:hypothetical protein [Bdellovibrionales bacterium]